MAGVSMLGRLDDQATLTTAIAQATGDVATLLYADQWRPRMMNLQQSLALVSLGLAGIKATGRA